MFNSLHLFDEKYSKKKQYCEILLQFKELFSISLSLPLACSLQGWLFSIRIYFKYFFFLGSYNPSEFIIICFFDCTKTQKYYNMFAYIYLIFSMLINISLHICLSEKLFYSQLFIFYFEICILCRNVCFCFGLCDSDHWKCTQYYFDGLPVGGTHIL